MAAEPIVEMTRGEAAAAAAPRRLRLAPWPKGSGATATAIACSAVLHGALAATILIWPEAPVPYPVGGPIVVSLVAMAPTEAEPSGDSGEPSPTAADQPTPSAEAPEPSAAPPTGPAMSADRSSAPEPEPSQEAVAAADLAILPASGEDTSPPPAEVPVLDAVSLPSKATVMLSMVRPLQRPFTIASGESGPVPPTPAVPRNESVIAPVRDGSDSSANRERGEGSEEMAAVPPAAAADPTETGNRPGTAGSMETAALGTSSIGPRFTMGSALNPRPRYPLAARRRGLEGRVVLRVFVEADGRVRSVDVIRSSSHAVLDTAAVEAITRWRFDPAKQSGVPVAGWVDIPVAFRLRD